MIFGVGVDIIEIKRVLAACEKESFTERVYTENERREASKTKKRLAGDFAVKEAVVKCFGTGLSKVSLKEIEVLRDDAGKPYVILYGNAESIAGDSGITDIHISISDTDELVMAFAVAEINP